MKNNCVVGWVLVVMVVGGLFYLGRELASSHNSPPEAVNPSLAEADIRLEHLQFRETKGEDLLWQLEASSAELFEEQRCTRAKDVKLILYENQQPALEVTSRKGELNLDNRNITLTGEVYASSAQGFELKTESLTWWQAEQRITTKAPVSLSRAGFQLQGRGLEADVSLERVTVLDAVNTIIN